MIVYDQSEEHSSLPTIEGAKPSPVLEKLTGADLMVSAAPWPATTETLLKRHAIEGALFVQGKWSMSDLTASIQDGRLLAALTRMVEFGLKPVQCVVLVVGEPPDVRTPEYGALSKWQDRGGRVEPFLRMPDDVIAWCKAKERHLQEYEKHRLHWFYDAVPTLDQDPEDDPLQLVARVPASDPRRAVIQCPGIGPELATAWWEACSDAPMRTLFYMLAWMSAEAPDVWNMPKVPGYGTGKRLAMRQWLGLPPGWDLGMKESLQK